MFLKSVYVLFVLSLWISCDSFPISSDNVDDTVVVGSVIREVRAIPPNAYVPVQNGKQTKDLAQAGTSDHDPDNFEHHWSTGDKGDKGYIKNEEGKGSQGYKHYDSFHKKDGDKYDFEHHTAFGHGDKDEKDGYEHHSKFKNAKDNEDGKKQDGKKGEGTHNSYQVSENVSEDDDAFEPYNFVSGNYKNQDDDDSSDKSNYNNEQEYADDTEADDESEAYTADENEDESAAYTDDSEKDKESENLEEYDDY